MDLDPAIAMLKGSLSELKNFKVLGTIDKVLLVMDKTSDETYVVKVRSKTMVNFTIIAYSLNRNNSHFNKALIWHRRNCSLIYLINYLMRFFLKSDVQVHVHMHCSRGIFYCTSVVFLCQTLYF